MKSLLLLPVLLYLLPSLEAFRFVSKVEELPVDSTDRLEIIRPKVRLCGSDSDEDSADCVLCTVCHPHEYELIGCNGQIDSVCASCTTGWLRSTPKTIDFFRKCKRHPQLPFVFPDVPYPMRVQSDPSSMFSDQEKMLQDAENNDVELSEELSEEDDYEGEEEEDENAVLDITAVREEGSEEDEFADTGVEPVEIDEGEDSFEDYEEENMNDLLPRMYQFHRELEQMISEKLEKNRDEEVIESVEDEDSVEVKEEERADPFDEKKEESVEEEKEEGSEQKEEEEEEEVLTYPLHRANIWRIMGSELGRADDKDITKEVRKAISDRKKKWQLQKIMNRRRSGSSEEIEATELQNDFMELKGGYRPLAVRAGGEMHVEMADSFTSVPPLIGALCFALLALCIVFTVKICMMRRTNRVIILPELDEMSRQLINEAHARVHSKKEKKIRPEFV
ncbi:hypothetical protein PMAYCL1PPCAC_30950 [Pristionchus mayeri]|uniref:TNFR-Cys domain-containing protein n=1 Tax=Pristionchus mayeri TaxID=1317129 RepID=A0AAN5DDM3_9BILA|nr:hypothetical protein PMAYCL1PPCAC_30950 [Pristionchus mayeri]